MIRDITKRLITAGGLKNWANLHCGISWPPYRTGANFCDPTYLVCPKIWFCNPPLIATHNFVTPLKRVVKFWDPPTVFGAPPAVIKVVSLTDNNNIKKTSVPSPTCIALYLESCVQSATCPGGHGEIISQSAGHRKCGSRDNSQFKKVVPVLGSPII